MLLHDSISQRKTQPDTLPHVLRRIERLEDARKSVIAQARPVVPKRHNRPAFFAPVLRGNLNAPGRVGRSNRLLGIHHDVEKHLVKEERIGLNAWKLLVIVSHDFDLTRATRRLADGQG